MNNIIYKTLIIGAGQIAGGYDNPADEMILSHAHAFINNPNTKLLGFYDINFEQAQTMAQKWSVDAFHSLKEIDSVDIISICTPDFCHLQSVKAALNLNPQIIILEKPVSNNQKDATEIFALSKKTPMMVNFTRRYVKEFQDLANQIKSGYFGEFKTGTGYYGKGYIHIGSHMRNLLELLLGKIIDVQRIDNGFCDYTKDDLTLNVILKFPQSFYMQAMPCYDYNIFEIDLMFEKGRIRISELGNKIEIFKPQESKIQKDYIILELEKTYSTEMKFAMKNAVKNVVNYLNGVEELISPIGELL